MIFGLKGAGKAPSWIRACMLVLLASLATLLMSPASAAVTANITGTNPPSGVTVEAGSVFPLMVGVSYNVPPDIAKQVGGYVLWLTIDGKSSNVIPFAGPGSYTFQFKVQAPPNPGTYTMNLALYILTKPDYQQNMPGQLRDTATFTYQVKPKAVTDWEVKRVWITPEAPSPGDEVTFHATLALQSTTSSQSLSVKVLCLLDEKPYYSGSLSFSPQPSRRDISVPKPWMASEGSHTLTFIIDPDGIHNDPTPYPKYNFKEYRFTVELYYAVILNLTTPATVTSGEAFDVLVHVHYKFPSSTQLRITNVFPVNTTGEELFDTVSGDGFNSYTYHVEAPTLPYSSEGNATPVNGFSQVEFDRGSGWRHTDPGWQATYTVGVRRPLYYAVFRMVDIVYLGEARPFDPRNPRGHFKATLAVEYLVPLESAKLRLVLADQSKGIRVYDVTEGAKGEGLRSYPIEFDLPLDLTARSYSELFEVEVSYQAEGEWHVGDSASRSTQVSISEEAVKAQPERGAPQASPLKPLIDFFEGIIDFFRRLFS